MFNIKKINDHELARKFAYHFYLSSHADIPPSYFLKGKTYLFVDNDTVHGGYSLIKSGTKRTFDQIPSNMNFIDYLEFEYYYRNSTEITGYFINLEKWSFLIVLHFLINIMLTNTKYFVYAYDMNNKKLKKLYSYGKPFRLYSGLVVNQIGMVGKHFENVEIITKFGFLRLWINRLFRKTLRWK